MTAKRRGNPRLILFTYDDARGVCLIRGSKAGEVVRYCDNNRAKWSESGNGWVVPRDVAVNAAAWAEYAGLMVVTTKPRRAGAA